MHLLIRQRFTDYARWRHAYDSMAETRAEYGLRTVLLARNRDDTNEVVVLFDVEDPERAMGYMRGSALADAWEAGGVIPESNQVTVLEEADDGITSASTPTD